MLLVVVVPLLVANRTAGKAQEKLLRKCPVWREARAEVRKITNRLNRCADKEALQAEVHHT